MRKLTVRDLLDAKGRRKLVLSTAFDYWTAKVCEEAGVDMILSWGCNMEHSRYVIEEVRKGAPNTLIGSGIPTPEGYSSSEAALRLAGELQCYGVDILYCSGLIPERFEPLAKQKYPCVGHVGYLPIQNTWLGKPRAVGKTADEAIKVLDDTIALANAGVIGVEMECVPQKVAAEITKRVDILTFSMGSGPDCDGQFLFACDILGTNDGHYPRHCKTYVPLLDMATKAMTQYRQEVVSGAYPEPKHCIPMKDDQYEQFMEILDKRDNQT